MVQMEDTQKRTVVLKLMPFEDVLIILVIVIAMGHIMVVPVGKVKLITVIQIPMLQLLVINHGNNIFNKQLFYPCHIWQGFFSHYKKHLVRVI